MANFEMSPETKKVLVTEEKDQNDIEKSKDVNDLIKPFLINENKEFKSTLVNNPNINYDKIKNSKQPYFNVRELPSFYAFYPDDTTIFYKSQKWSTVEYLKSSSLDILTEWSIYEDHIESTIPKDDISYSDFLYICLAIRIMTVGKGKFEVPKICRNPVEVLKDNKPVLDANGDVKIKACGHENNFVLQETNDIKTSDIKYTDDFKLTKKDFPYIINILGEDLNFSPVTLGNMKYLIKHNLVNDPIARIAVQCRNYSFELVYDLLQSDELDYLTGEELSNLNEKFYHGIEPINKNCEKCGKSNTINLQGGGIIIKPFRKH